MGGTPAFALSDEDPAWYLPVGAPLVAEMPDPENSLAKLRSAVGAIDAGILNGVDTTLRAANLPFATAAEMRAAGLDTGERVLAFYFPERRGLEARFGFLFRADPGKLRAFLATQGFTRGTEKSDTAKWNLGEVWEKKTIAANGPTPSANAVTGLFAFFLKNDAMLIASHAGLAQEARAAAGRNFFNESATRNLAGKLSKSIINLYLNPKRITTVINPVMRRLGLGMAVVSKFNGIYAAAAISLEWRDGWLSLRGVGRLDKKHRLYSAWSGARKKTREDEWRYIPAAPLAWLQVNIDLEGYLAFLRAANPEFARDLQNSLAAAGLRLPQWSLPPPAKTDIPDATATQPETGINEQSLIKMVSGGLALAVYGFDPQKRGFSEWLACVGARTPGDAARLADTIAAGARQRPGMTVVTARWNGGRLEPVANGANTNTGIDINGGGYLLRQASGDTISVTVVGRQVALSGGDRLPAALLAARAADKSAAGSDIEALSDGAFAASLDLGQLHAARSRLPVEWQVALTPLAALTKVRLIMRQGDDQDDYALSIRVEKK